MYCFLVITRNTVRRYEEHLPGGPHPWLTRKALKLAGWCSGIYMGQLFPSANPSPPCFSWAGGSFLKFKRGQGLGRKNLWFVMSNYGPLIFKTPKFHCQHYCKNYVRVPELILALNVIILLKIFCFMGSIFCKYFYKKFLPFT